MSYNRTPKLAMVLLPLFLPSSGRVCHFYFPHHEDQWLLPAGGVVRLVVTASVPPHSLLVEVLQVEPSVGFPLSSCHCGVSSHLPLLAASNRLTAVSAGREEAGTITARLLFGSSLAAVFSTGGGRGEAEGFSSSSVATVFPSSIRLVDLFGK